MISVRRRTRATRNRHATVINAGMISVSSGPACARNLATTVINAA